ncbi:hypothetical protein E1B28_008953 [Marasmius oreades]|uniref:LIM zinc-binding domain-containing protein n=1 Tax=Marasmius oreades TaxID=181124 RepID=A0A9P7RZL0_9AGAR|nr:uncharacterized protein E1B28_008953 [Marasmius oreades]KAG7092610.1 hypothetical protein E1B28_008953 [Marasmius oreades]
MATALAPPSSDTGRISQLLPTVKCSICNEPVRLADLGEHICPSSSPSSKLTSKISRMMSPGPRSSRTTRTSFSTMRSRSASSVSSAYSEFPLAIPPVSSPPPLPKTSPPSQSTHPISHPYPASLRDRSYSTVSNSPRSPRTPPPSSRSPPHPQPILPSLSRSPAPTPSPGPIPLTPPPATFSRVETSRTPAFPPQHSPRTDARLSSTPYVISTHSPRPLPPSSPGVIATDPPGSPSTLHFSQPATSHHPDSPSFPSNPLPPILPPQFPPGPSRHTQQGLQHGHSPTGSMFSTHGTIVRSPEPDTKIGGEAGMAGVGRRGFAAVAGAALFVIPRAQGRQDIGYPMNPITIPPTQTRPDQAVQSRPQFLDISAANKAIGPSLHSPSTLSPRSPLSSTPTSPTTPRTPRTPDARTAPPGHPAFLVPGSPGGHPSSLLAGSPRGSPTGPAKPSGTPDAYFPPESKSPPSQSPPSHTRNLSTSSDGSEVGLAYTQSVSYEDDEVEDFVSRAQNARRRRSTSRARSRQDSMSSSTSSGGGTGRGVPQRKNSHTLPGEGEIPPLPISSGKGLELETAFNAVAASSSADGISLTSPTELSVNSISKLHVPLRSNTVQGLTTPKSEVDPFDSFMAKLPMRSNTERASSSNYQHYHGKEKTMPGLNSTKGDSTKSRNRVKLCVGCEKRIEDGRWVQVDDEHGKGKQRKGVLCEGCWKGMYLPKCRRCQLPIEKHAISSSDGQLKGKYHKECFTCFECKAPFPNKTFYVFNDQPLCGYHYAKHNNSLCNLSSCAQPIEGPCAVDHKGGRYHPAHFLCMWDRCTEKLDKEYWEVDGKVVCERHAQMQFRQSRMFGLGGSRKSRAWALSLYGAEGVYDGVRDEEEESRYDSEEEFGEDSAEWKAMKRTTRFIDLGSLGLGGTEGRQLK